MDPKFVLAKKGILVSVVLLTFSVAYYLGCKNTLDFIN